MNMYVIQEEGEYIGATVSTTSAFDPLSETDKAITALRESYDRRADLMLLCGMLIGILIVVILNAL